jgi:uncharacterized membrane protein
VPRSGALHEISPSDHAINAVAQIEHSAREARSRIDHFGSTITRAAGTAQSIVFHLVWFLVWLLVNLDTIPGIQPFDPFPFNLLTTVVSLEAIFLTLFVLISQNRLSQEADKRAHLDLQVNLLAREGDDYDSADAAGHLRTAWSDRILDKSIARPD